MKKWQVFVLTGTLIFSTSHLWPLISQKPSLHTYTDSLLQAKVDSSLIAGASLMIFQNGEVLHHQSYGYAKLEFEVPMPLNASFEIGSVTKQFTAAAILKLMEEGKLSLEDDMTSYVDFNTRGRKVTIRMLLNHTSGIPGYTELAEFATIMDRRLRKDSLLRLVEKHDFLFEPGEAMIYNNTGYFLLGLIIEKISGMNYEDFLTKHFFKPLGMENTYYSSNTEVVSGRASGYTYRPKQLVKKQYIDYTWPFSAGSLSSTAEDLLVWMRALHGGELLQQESYEWMTQPGKLNDGTGLRYAMGLVNLLNSGHRQIGHGGGIPGFVAETRYFPAADLYIICLLNTAGPVGADALADELTWQILDKKDVRPVKLDINPKKLSGTYSGQVRGRASTVEVKGLKDAICIRMPNTSSADTIDTYIGHFTWRNRNTLISFLQGKLHLDQAYAHYVFSLSDE